MRATRSRSSPARFRSHKPVSGIYAEKLAAEGVTTAAEVAGWLEAQKKRLYEIYDQTVKTKEEYELLEMSPASPETMPPVSSHRRGSLW